MARRRTQPLNALVDTCVWLDLAKDYREQPIISAIEDLVKEGRLRLIIPSVVLDEFQRNKARVAEEAKRGFQSHFRVVRDAVNRFADDASKAHTIAALHEVDHAITMKSAAVDGSLMRIENILASTPAVPTSETVKQRVTERALAKLAPYHREKNSVGDAILIETYAEVLSSDRDKKPRYAFVTHNTKDFSEPNGDRRKPHGDLAPMFVPPRSTYSVSMVDLIREVDADLLDEHVFEISYSQQARTLSEILDTERLFMRQVWYNRHWNRRAAIEEGRIHVVPEESYSRKPYRPDQILDTIWAGALAAAVQTEEEVGIENLGPWDDFEWGMLNGKLSALRWVLGDDWDMLDT